jgi:hypothetical protein
MTDLPDVKLKALVCFPASIVDGIGVDITKSNGTYRFDIAYDDFAPPVVGAPDPTHQNVLLWNSLTSVYSLVPISVVGSGGAVNEAPNDGTQYGRQSLAWTPIPTGVSITPSALTRTNDTNVTLTLAGTPNTALLQATSITAGWSGTLAPARGGWGIDISASSGVPLFTTGVPTFTAVTGTGSFVCATSPLLAGDPRAPTPTAGDNDTSIATTAFVTTAVSSGLSGSGFAPIASPTFTGNPAAPTPTAGDNDTSIATTAFVTSAVSTGVTGLAPIASPTFTGNPSAPTPTAGDNDTSIATTAFVTAALPVAATAAEYAANSAPTKMLTPGAAWNAAPPVGLSGATVAPNLSLGFDFTWTMSSATSTLNNPTNLKSGQKGMLYLVQSTGGAIITTWGSFYKFPGGVKPTLSTAASAVDVISFAVKSSTEVECFFAAGMA